MRGFAWFVAAIVLAGVLAALIAFPVYQLTTGFAHFAFHRVASRIAMLFLIGELIWLCRHLSLTRKRDFGYGLPWRRFLKVSFLAGLAGIFSAALGATFLLATHLRIVDPNFVPSLTGLLRLLGIGLSSGIAVALLEETVMRGAMHTAIEREAGPLTAALLTAPLFAVLHFFAKVRIPESELNFGSGFVLISRSFEPLGHLALVYDAFLSWLVVGVILSATRVLTGNIAAAIGLHAGWVVVLRMLQEATSSNAAPGYAVWVGRFDGLLGLWLLPWGALIALLLWASRAIWVPFARSTPPLG